MVYANLSVHNYVSIHRAQMHEIYMRHTLCR